MKVNIKQRIRAQYNCEGQAFVQVITAEQADSLKVQYDGEAE